MSEDNSDNSDKDLFGEFTRIQRVNQVEKSKELDDIFESIDRLISRDQVTLKFGNHKTFHC